MEVVEVQYAAPKVRKDTQIKYLLYDIHCKYYTKLWRNECIRQYNKLTGENMPEIE